MRSDNADTKALFIFNIFLSGRQSIKSLCSLWPYGPMGFNHISNIKPLHDDPKYAKAPRSTSMAVLRTLSERSLNYTD